MSHSQCNGAYGAATQARHYRTQQQLCCFNSQATGENRWNCGYHDGNCNKADGNCKKGGMSQLPPHSSTREEYTFLQGTVRPGRPMCGYLSGATWVKLIRWNPGSELSFSFRSDQTSPMAVLRDRKLPRQWSGKNGLVSPSAFFLSCLRKLRNGGSDKFQSFSLKL